MARVPQRDLPIGPGGVAAEMGTTDPRRARKRVAPTAGRAQAEPPPEDKITESEWTRMLTPRRLPGRTGKPTGRIRWGHRVIVDGRVAFCHAFTVPRAVHDAVRAGEALSCEGATLPDGRPVVPKGADPTEFSVRCASCGAEQVRCREMLFYEE